MSRKFSRLFYNSKEWKAVRQYVLMRDRFLCQKCGAPAEEVHHIIHLTPENIWDPKIALNPENLVSLCRDDHFAEHVHDKEAGKRRKYGLSEGDCADGFHFDENGQVVPN
jgi:5-methylcytosine-specific restriction endonuclease McrA